MADIDTAITQLHLLFDAMPREDVQKVLTGYMGARLRAGYPLDVWWMLDELGYAVPIGYSPDDIEEDILEELSEQGAEADITAADLKALAHAISAIEIHDEWYEDKWRVVDEFIDELRKQGRARDITPEGNDGEEDHTQADAQ